MNYPLKFMPKFKELLEFRIKIVNHNSCISLVQWVDKPKNSYFLLTEFSIPNSNIKISLGLGIIIYIIFVFSSKLFIGFYLLSNHIYLQCVKNPGIFMQKNWKLRQIYDRWTKIEKEIIKHKDRQNFHA